MSLFSTSRCINTTPSLSCRAGFWGLVLCFGLSCEWAVSEEGLLPKPTSPSLYRREFSSSIFQRELVQSKTVTEREVNDFASQYQLEGLVSDGAQGNLAFVKDLKDNRLMVVTRKTNADGMKMIDSKMGSPKESYVIIAKGTQRGTLRYNDSRFQNRAANAKAAATQSKKPGKFPPGMSMSNAPRPGQVPGQNVVSDPSAMPPGMMPSPNAPNPANMTPNNEIPGALPPIPGMSEDMSRNVSKTRQNGVNPGP